ncbi:MAG: four helix bundle protein [Melioribacteraceae bacterium]|nr:four helix bundle protein [Melioribacteraceae bacterium]
MSKSILRDKSYSFAVRIVNLFKFLQNEKKEYILSKQLMRSGTSVGALVREAEFADGKADFIHKLAIAQKDSNESIYWLELLQDTDYLEKNEFSSINEDAI